MGTDSMNIFEENGSRYLDFSLEVVLGIQAVSGGNNRIEITFQDKENEASLFSLRDLGGYISLPTTTVDAVNNWDGETTVLRSATYSQKDSVDMKKQHEQVKGSFDQ